VRIAARGLLHSHPTEQCCLEARELTREMQADE